MLNLSEQLSAFIKASPSCFHAAANIASELERAGGIELFESDDWKLERGRVYYVRRNQSSIIGFRLPEVLEGGFMIAAAHTDSPTFRVKSNPELEGGQYVRINTERYGGMLVDSWLDRPLSVAGRVVVRTNNGISSRLVEIDRDMLIIPRVAIHMMNTNDGKKYEPTSDLVPIYGMSEEKGAFMRELADELDVDVTDILATDLFLVNRQTPTIWGARGEFISAPRLDDLECAFLATRAFAEASESTAVQVLFAADNEEVGSHTKQGAASTFLADVLYRAAASMGCGELEFRRMIAKSMLVSADNAHAVHPNHPELADPVHRPLMNAGVVIKFSASQTYTTDAVSAAIFVQICKKAGAPVQIFHNRSDMRGGSTLGNISNTQLSMMAVDIGLAQLAMHSSFETAGTFDLVPMCRAIRTFYETELTVRGDEFTI